MLSIKQILLSGLHIIKIKSHVLLVKIKNAIQIQTHQYKKLKLLFLYKYLLKKKYFFL